MKTLWKDRTGVIMMFDVDRNEECPCGSKIKFKYCCIDRVTLPTIRIKGKLKDKRIKKGVLL
jgi:hypothetical protein